MKVERSVYHLSAMLALVVILIYSAYRAFVLSLTHDEALTFIYFGLLPKTYSEVIQYQILTTNNHLLNSVLIKFLTSRLGNSEFIIRLPALLGHCLYLAGTFLSLRLAFKGRALLLTTLLLTLHPFLIDYFSCARGYALGMGFMSFAFYFVLKKIQKGYFTPNGPQVFLIMIFLALAAISNLAFLLPMLAVILFFLTGALINVVRTQSHRMNIIKQSVTAYLVPIIVPVIGLFLLYAAPIQKLKAANEFYHGGTSGLWHDTITSLIKVTTHDQNFAFMDGVFIFKLFVIVVMFVASARVLQFLFKQNVQNQNQRFLIFTVCVQWIALAGILLQHTIFEGVFPYDRAVMFLIPLFLMTFIFLGAEIAHMTNRILQGTVRWLYRIVFILLILHFVRCMNTQYFLLNKPDAHTKEMMRTLVALNRGKQLAPRSVNLGIHWWFEPAINYYIIKENIYWLNRVNRSGPEGQYDYYYLRKPNKHLIDDYNLTLIRHYPFTDTYLARPQE